ncbi:hypothetical protein FDG95_gp423 [Pectobacterium phage vB_PcaM_CBB]|uniref:Uncharacterized protein n=1 Tax=Pectobacterium phage vB_PcaM_CBB TaxID=2772511 RepID=A0A1L2CU75_9CAUD|nr:hypothetical protein FDG95_gp003 [Pectobacterium phage vB_PcaM_CBB]YP_009595096.1 hypothetical protein FDG95_gp423 [Pectobacterium phage vB_PcaM_CBB]AMM43568.1 hypothetical protein CBB_3 [Pectobacterium phage vB_PcaM_CBB]AMM44119.1 hypothetical protein CBB_556 [Pectobacterium phage vB_PcaM_CBB]
MTTTNNAKATKVTLNSIVFAPAPVLRELKEGENYTKTELKAHEKEMGEYLRTTSHDLAMYLVNKTDNTDTIVKLFAATAEAIPTVLAEVLKQREEEEAAKQAEREKAEEEKRRLAEQEEKELQAKKDEMLKHMTDVLGLDLDVAKAAVETVAKKLNVGNHTKNSYERVTCTIEGNQYDVPVRGNMSQALKDLAAKYGFADDRDGFIEKFRDEPATADADKDTAEA